MKRGPAKKPAEEKLYSRSIAFEPELYEAARKKAAEGKLNISQYIRSLVRADLGLKPRIVVVL